MEAEISVTVCSFHSRLLYRLNCFEINFPRFCLFHDVVPWVVDCNALTASLHTCSLHVPIRASRKLVKYRNLHPEGIHRRTDTITHFTLTSHHLYHDRFLSYLLFWVHIVWENCMLQQSSLTPISEPVIHVNHGTHSIWLVWIHWMVNVTLALVCSI